jgi:glycosyltransferase involved in cell wall biosynthesis
VKLLCPEPAGGESAPVPGLDVEAVKASPGSRLAANLAHPDPRIPMQVRLFLDQGMRRAVRREITAGVDVLHVTLARMGPYMPPARAGLHRHVDLMDSFSINMRTRAESGSQAAALPFRAEARLLAGYEARLAAEADSASLVSAADTEAPGLADVTVIPNGVDQEAFPFEPPAEARPELVFFGNLGYFHNIASAEFVAQEVLPRVRAAEPRATLRLVGARPAPAVQSLGRLDGVEVTGQVAAMGPELRRAGVAVLPLFSGSGIKNKVLEAFASGLPVVSNALGIQGVDGAVAGRDFLAAETPEELARAVGELLSDGELRMRTAEAALRLVERDYTWSAQARRLMGLYGYA